MFDAVLPSDSSAMGKPDASHVMAKSSMVMALRTTRRLPFELVLLTEGSFSGTQEV